MLYCRMYKRFCFFRGKDAGCWTMEAHEIYEKHLCMTELRVERYETTENRRVEVPSARQDARFLYIYKGEAILQSPRFRLCAARGELLYLPEDSGDCHIFWSGTDGIAYIALRIVSKHIDMANNDRYAVQRVEKLSTPETGALFQSIFALFQSADKTPAQWRIDRVRAIGMYYAFYADALPCLSAPSTVSYNTVLRDAVSYIEAHLAADFDMDVLAQAVCVSPSHLFHLFRDELGTTPVRYRNERRIEQAARDLRAADESVDKIALRNGFHSAVYFHRIFKAATGMTPGEYREATRYGK